MLVLVALLGAGLLIAPYVIGPVPESDGGAGQPEWFTRAPTKNYFKDLLVPELEPGEDDDVLAQLVAEEIDHFRGVDSGLAKARLTRVLPRGFEFDSQLLLRYSQSGDVSQVALQVLQDEVETVSYYAEVTEEKIERVEMARDGEVREVNFGKKEPVSLGDLRLLDLFDLYNAAKAGEFRIVGTLAVSNSVEIKVFESPLAVGSEPEDGGSAAQRELSAPGASALLYCDAYDLTPRTIRIFDAKDRLVRTYSDLVFEPVAGEEGARHGENAEDGEIAEDELRLRSFRVDSLVTNSVSSFHVTAVERDDEDSPRSAGASGL